MKKKLSVLLVLTMLFTLFLTACGNDKKDDGKAEKKETVTEAKVDEEKEADKADDKEESKEEADDKEESAKVKDSLIYAVNGEPSNLDPTRSSDNIASQVFRQIFDTIIHMEADGTLNPGLATEFEVVDDGKAVIYTIREGVTFHNGDEMTVKDVAFSLNRAIESEFTSEYTSMMESAEVVEGENKVRLNLKYPFAGVNSCVAKICVLSEAVVEELGDDHGMNPVGTGPYEFVEFKKGDQIKLKAYEGYYRGVAEIKDLTFKIITEPSTAVVALETGDIDFLVNPARVERQRLIDSDKLQYHETEVSGNNYIAFNNTDGPFADKTLRQAISYAIDKESVMIGSLEGAGLVIDNPIPRAHFGFSEDVKANPYDPEKAKELLAEAGYKEGELSITLKSMESELYRKPTEIIQDQLTQIGINAEVEVMERGAALEDIYENSRYGMAVWSMIYEYPDADSLYPFFHSKGGLNFLQAKYPELDKLFDQARLELDDEKRAKIYEDVANFINEEVVIVPLFTYYTAVAADANLQGVEPSVYTIYEVYNMSWAK